MSFVTYTARRSLVSGHVAETDYNLELELTDRLVPSVEDLKKKQESLSGKVETQFYGQVKTREVELAPVSLENTAQIIEFLDSTADGQEFIFDPYGTEAEPSDYATAVIREDTGYSERRFMTRSGLNDAVQYTFTVREA